MKTTIRCCAAAILAFLISFTSLQAQAPAAKPAPLQIPQIKFQKYKLDNGLEVILYEDHRLPLVAVNLFPGTDKARVGARLLETHRPALFYFLTFMNLPRFLILAAWTATTAELKAVVDAVAKDEAVKSATCNVALAGFVFETWRDKLVEAAKPVPPGGG